jgi:heme-degrading monooxygenase HmoA
MTAIYTSGTWQLDPGNEEAFVAAWTEFARWASGMPGAGTLRLARDLRASGRFVSFGAWDSLEAVRAWKSAPDFRERMAHLLQHVAEFEPSELAVVASAETGAQITDPAPVSSSATRSQWSARRAARS